MILVSKVVSDQVFWEEKTIHIMDLFHNKIIMKISMLKISSKIKKEHKINLNQLKIFCRFHFKHLNQLQRSENLFKNN